MELFIIFLNILLIYGSFSQIRGQKKARKEHERKLANFTAVRRANDLSDDEHHGVREILKRSPRSRIVYAVAGSFSWGIRNSGVDVAEVQLLNGIPVLIPDEAKRYILSHNHVEVTEVISGYAVIALNDYRIAGEVDGSLVIQGQPCANFESDPLAAQKARLSMGQASLDIHNLSSPPTQPDSPRETSSETQPSGPDPEKAQTDKSIPSMPSAASTSADNDEIKNKHVEDAPLYTERVATDLEARYVQPMYRYRLVLSLCVLFAIVFPWAFSVRFAFESMWALPSIVGSFCVLVLLLLMRRAPTSSPSSLKIMRLQGQLFEGKKKRGDHFVGYLNASDPTMPSMQYLRYPARWAGQFPLSVDVTFEVDLARTALVSVGSLQITSEDTHARQPTFTLAGLGILVVAIAMSSQIEWKTYDAVFAIVDNTASSYVIKNEADWSIRDTLVPGDALTISQPRFCLEASTMLSDRKHYCDQFRYPLDEPQTPDYSQPVQMASYYRLMQETPEYQPVIPEEMYRSLAEKFRLQQLYTGEHYSKRIRKRDEMLWYSAADIVAIAQHLQPYCEQVGNICDDVKEDLSRLWQEGTDKPCKNACWSAILTASDDVDFHILSNVSEVNSLNYIDRGIGHALWDEIETQIPTPELRGAYIHIKWLGPPSAEAERIDHLLVKKGNDTAVKVDRLEERLSLQDYLANQTLSAVVLSVNEVDNSGSLENDALGLSVPITRVKAQETVIYIRMFWALCALSLLLILMGQIRFRPRAA